MSRFIYSFLFVIGFASVSSFPIEANQKAGCVIDIQKDFTYKHPLVLKPEADEFIYPQQNDGIHFASGEQFRIACPGNHISVAPSKVQEAKVTCISGKNFNVSGVAKITTFKDLHCDNYPKPWGQKTGEKCLEKYTEMEIGFQLSTGFVRTIVTCLDESKSNSLYSSYNLSSGIGQQQIKTPKPNYFLTGSFYPGLNPDSLYKKTGQFSMFSKLLGSATQASKYIDKNSNQFFLSRGHLTANADFVYSSQQRSTYFFINVAPQWQIFNEKNWNTLEQDVRKYAGNTKKNLEIYTGVWGVSHLPDINNNLVSLGLFKDSNGQLKLNVPEVYWKVLYDPETKDGVAFVGHNNPYETDVAKRVICTNVCDKIEWLRWNPSNVTQGYSYCCDVNDLKKVVEYLPNLTVHNLLV